MIFYIEPQQKGHFRIVGELTFNTVPEIAKKGLALFNGAGADLRIDLREVSRTDSAGLALLIAWLRYAKKENKSLQFLNIPAQMLAIAQISSLDQILPLGEEQVLGHPPLALGQDKKFTSPSS